MVLGLLVFLEGFGELWSGGKHENYDVLVVFIEVLVTEFYESLYQL